ncbi:thioredoxin [Geitlerinema sp. PCC 7407]|jgi:thioredoxin|uniref:thioredoxin n=1 Tax=Geitlerinema sp. PCC 7407 TaxID=1173025 RepID=UPI00029FE0A6|nr:thioredoxin [Geitlerinema sp. PCC 7407]AFY67022.1 thioredoxin [Geitlerinema sp. PCC 7407]
MAIKKQFTSFQDLLAESEVPLLVDFYAAWCGPCQMMAPILEQVQHRLSGRLKVVKIDTDRYPQLASRYGIQALPTLVVFKQGQPVDRLEGVMQAEQLISRLQSVL